MATDAATSIHEIAPGVHRISTPVGSDVFPGGFSFNQYLLVDDAPLLFHTGPRRMFPRIRAAIETVLPLDRLRYVGFSHVEADECGSLAEFLAAAPQARPVCSDTAARTWVRDAVDVAPIAMKDGQQLDLGHHELVWQSTPHLPHGTECGFLFDSTTATLFCGDLFAQGGAGERPLSRDDIFRASEAFRFQTDFYSHSRETPILIEKLAQLEPRMLACMHGSAWIGDGASLLRRLGKALDED